MSLGHRRTPRLSLLRMPLLLLLLLVLSQAVSSATSPSLRYQVNPTISTGGRSCPAKYSCNGITQNGKECSCHPYCYMFDSCCSDQRWTNATQARLSRDMFRCVSLTTLAESEDEICKQGYNDIFSIYVIDKCPESFFATAISNLCEVPLAEMDNGTLSLPVTEATTGATYRNIFCALCNGATAASVVVWTLNYYCNQTVEKFNSETGEQYDKRTFQQLLETNDTLRQQYCVAGYLPPQRLNVSLHECRENVVATCPDNSSHAAQANCSDAVTRYVYDWKEKTIYRNLNCAFCDANFTTPLYCAMWTPNVCGGSTVPVQFSLLLTIDYHCPSSLTPYMSEQVQDTWRSVCPGMQIGLEYLNCSQYVNVSTMIELYQKSPREYRVYGTFVSARYNATFVTCALCDARAHSLTIHVNASNVTINEKVFFRPFFSSTTDTALVCDCESESANEAQDAGPALCKDLPFEVDNAFMALSVLCLFLYGGAYAILPSLRNLPGQIILQESIAFFLGFLLFLLSGFATPNSIPCVVLAVLVHYFFLAAFVWTSIYAIEVVRVLSVQTQATFSTKRRLRYAIAGYLLPAVVVAAALTIEHNDAADQMYLPYYGVTVCFISQPLSNRVFFIAPLAACLGNDVISYAYVVVKLVLISRQTKLVRDTHHEKILLSIKLIVALGLLWIFAISAAITGDCTLTDIFTLLNSLQGVFIFVIFICNSKTMKALLPKVRSVQVAKVNFPADLRIRDAGRTDDTERHCSPAHEVA